MQAYDRPARVNAGMREFPELDRAQWLTLEDAAAKILKGQAVFLSRLSDAICRLPGSSIASASTRSTR